MQEAVGVQPGLQWVHLGDEALPRGLVLSCAEYRAEVGRGWVEVGGSLRGINGHGTRYNKEKNKELVSI